LSLPWTTLFNAFQSPTEVKMLCFFAPFRAKIDICCFWPRRWI